jgi:hypothetical protein
VSVPSGDCNNAFISTSVPIMLICLGSTLTYILDPGKLLHIMHYSWIYFRAISFEQLKITASVLAAIDQRMETL